MQPRTACVVFILPIDTALVTNDVIEADKEDARRKFRVGVETHYSPSTGVLGVTLSGRQDDTVLVQRHLTRQWSRVSLRVMRVIVDACDGACVQLPSLHPRHDSTPSGPKPSS
jgi:hypothetical protein